MQCLDRGNNKLELAQNDKERIGRQFPALFLSEARGGETKTALPGVGLKEKSARCGSWHSRAWCGKLAHKLLVTKLNLCLNY